MALKANYEFLFVGKDENSFLESYAYDLYQEHGEKSGEIFINLEIQNNPVDAEEIAGVVFETMQKVFFEDVSRDPYTRFEVALKAVNGILTQFKGQKSSGYIGNFNAVIAAIVGDDLFLTQCGEAEAYLIRKRYVSIVTDGLNEESNGDEIFSSIASGKIEMGDIVLFSTTRLVRYLSKNDLAESVHKRDITEALGDLRDRISTEILGRVGLTGMMFSEATREEIAEMEGESDSMNRSILEGNGSGRVSAKKESLVGKFFTAFKSFKDRRAKMPKSRAESRSSSGGGASKISNFLSGITSSGFGGKNKILVLLVLVIVVLGGLIFFANSNRAEEEKMEALKKVLIGVKDKIAEAETKGAYDKEKAKEVLDKAYLDAKSVLDSGIYRDKATGYLLQIEDTRDKLDNVKRVDAPRVFADLTKKRADVNALGFVQLSDRVFVFESDGLYEIVLDQVQDPVTIDDTEQVIAATGFDERNSVVFLTKSGKLIEFKDGNVSFMDSEDGAFRKGTALADWSNRIYVLDPSGNQIWKYTFKGSVNKFGTAESYVADKTDLSKAQDLAIDASVWVLENSGDILKFYGGNKAEFYINNPPFTMFKDPSVIYTDEKLDDVYVIDAKEARVLEFQKDSKTGDLIYTSQYLFEGVGEIRDLYVNADSKKMYVLTSTKILEVDL